jgi:hypothetical protein
MDRTPCHRVPIFASLRFSAGLPDANSSRSESGQWERVSQLHRSKHIGSVEERTNLQGLASKVLDGPKIARR